MADLRPHLLLVTTDPRETNAPTGAAVRLAPFRRPLQERRAHRADYRYDPAALRPPDNVPPSFGGSG